MTDLGVLEPDPETGELTMTVLHPEVTAEDARTATGWELKVADDVCVGQPPTRDELEVLRSLKTIEEDVEA